MTALARLFVATVATVVAWLSLGLVLVTAAHAHEFRPAYLSLHAHPGGTVDVRWRPPKVTGNGPVTSALAPVLPAHCRRLDDAGTHFDCGARGLAGQLRVVGLAAHPTDVVVDIVRTDGTTSTARLGPSSPTLALGGGASVDSTVAAVATYFGLGARHIGEGFDHLLLVLLLVLLARTPRALLAAVTGFTVGHCATLSWVVLGGATLPAAAVEATIVLSLVFVAVEVCRGPPSLGHRYPGVVAATIGLVHGLGFAGALVQLGVPAGHVGAALLGFNLGVEAGQLAWVLGACAVGVVLARRVDLPRLRHRLAWIIGHVAAAWTIARVVEMGGWG